MAHDAKSTNNALNRLIETCHDAHHGYQTAAHHVEDMELKKTLGRFAIERKQFADELSRRVDRKAGTPVHHGTFKGALHRGWMELKGKDKNAILKECVRGEDASVERFQGELDALSEELKTVVNGQLERILETRDHLKTLGA